MVIVVVCCFVDVVVLYGCLFVWSVCLSKVLASKNYLLAAAFTGTERLCELKSISYSSRISCEVK